MTRPTDLALISAYRQIGTDLLECLHASVEMLNKIGHVLPMGNARQVFDIGMDDLENQLATIRQRMKEVHALSLENVRITMHGGDDD